MNTVVDSLTTELSATNLWGVVGTTVPLLAVSVLFGLGFYLVKKILRRTGHAKNGGY